MPKRTTPERPSEVLAHELSAVRQRKGWTQQQLADRLKEIGAPLDRVMVAKIEKGLRGVSVDEALALAVALGVSPLALLLPRTGAAKVRLAARSQVMSLIARDWIRGTAPLDDFDERFFFEEVSDDEYLAYKRPEVRELVQITAALVNNAAKDDRTSMRVDVDVIAQLAKQLRNRLDREES